MAKNLNTFTLSLSVLLLMGIGLATANVWAEAAPTAQAAAAPLTLSESLTVKQEGGRNPTVAVCPRSRTVYLAWTQEIPGTVPQGKDGKKADPRLEVRVARSDDGGRSFAPPVVASAPGDRVESYTVSPTQVAVGPKGEVYVLYGHQDPEFKPAGRSVLRLVRSEDGGKRFSAPVEIGTESVEGVQTSVGMLNLLAAPNGSKGRLHAAWYTGSERQPGVFYARSDDEGKGFSEPIALLSDDWIPYGDVKLALDAKDNAWVAFEDRRGEEDLIQAARIGPDGRATLAQAWPGTGPDVAVDGDTAIVAWGTQRQGDEETGGGIGTRVLSLPLSP